MLNRIEARTFQRVNGIVYPSLEDVMRNKKSTSLPDLEEHNDQEIVADNIRASQAIYAAALLEELKAFQVVDRLVEHFQQGILPVGRGRVGRSLFKYWKNAPSRLAESDRRQLHARALGLPGGEVEVVPNQEFNDLWMRFLASVASLSREQTTGSATSSSESVEQENIKAAARKLAANLSLHGYGWAGFAAIELQEQIAEVTKLLSANEVLAAYGAQDMWQVIEQVAVKELGGARSSVRYRTMLTSGTTIIAWLAKNSRRLKAATAGPIISTKPLKLPQRRRDEARVNANPSDLDLLKACEQWLAVVDQ